MPLADLQLPGRLLAGGGPSSPDPRVLLALTTPLIGQFDPDFTTIMDDVVQLARQTFLTANERCFAVSGLASAGLEAVLNTLVQQGSRVAVRGDPEFTARTAEIARRYAADIVSDLDARPEFMVGSCADGLQELAAACHDRGTLLVVEATFALAARELRVDDWGIDICVAGVDYAVGAPPGLTLVTYSAEVERMFVKSPPTSYLDLVQLQAYWSPERLNHHTAPTSLVYALREALRLVHREGLEERWRRHLEIGQRLRDGLIALGLDVSGDPPFLTVQVQVNNADARKRLLEEFGVYVTAVGPRTWRVGLLGADARRDAVHRVLAAVEKVLAA